MPDAIYWLNGRVVVVEGFMECFMEPSSHCIALKQTNGYRPGTNVAGAPDDFVVVTLRDRNTIEYTVKRIRVTGTFRREDVVDPKSKEVLYMYHIDNGEAHIVSDAKVSAGM